MQEGKNYWYGSGIWTPYYGIFIQWHLKESQPSPFLGGNNITVPLKQGSRWSGWFTTEETRCTNSKISFLNIDNSTLYTEGNACGVISIPIIECDAENDYVHVSHDLSNK